MKHETIKEAGKLIGEYYRVKPGEKLTKSELQHNLERSKENVGKALEEHGKHFKHRSLALPAIGGLAGAAIGGAAGKTLKHTGIGVAIGGAAGLGYMGLARHSYNQKVKKFKAGFGKALKERQENPEYFYNVKK